MAGLSARFGLTKIQCQPCLAEVTDPRHVVAELAAIDSTEPLRERLIAAIEAIRAQGAHTGAVVNAVRLAAPSRPRSRESSPDEERTRLSESRNAGYSSLHSAVAAVVEPDADALRVPVGKVATLVLGGGVHRAVLPPDREPRHRDGGKVVGLRQQEVHELPEGELTFAADHDVDPGELTKYPLRLVRDVVAAEDNRALRVELLEHLGEQPEVAEVPAEHGKTDDVGRSIPDWGYTATPGTRPTQYLSG